MWGQPNHREVLYLLQSQQQDWPIDVALEVLAPGVASIEQDRLLGWVLHIAAYDPGDAPVDRATGNLDGSHRRPCFVRLQVSVPDRHRRGNSGQGSRGLDRPRAAVSFPASRRAAASLGQSAIPVRPHRRATDVASTSVDRR